VQSRDQWWALVKMVMNLQVPLMTFINQNIDLKSWMIHLKVLYKR